MNNERCIPIVWPERRCVPEGKLRTWFSDGVANGEITPDITEDLNSLEYMCREMHDVGIITLHQSWRDHL